ncbi:zinc finger protein 358 [Drosophila takahashii]|uniref:zinc finger protein 358 n=1 Tax=Drosophila takahashii TaxID=29030 RepID=UPI001CF92499|nr:zinc finger protein 35 [Drosophila takahashii]XP_017001693.2 zinc finger protein 35 [Drosophila takahashii]
MAVQLEQSYHHLPLTITPILHPTSHILQQQQQQQLPNPNPPQPQPPDLTFHCMCCAAFFVHPLALYQHMNTLHPNEHPSEQQEQEGPGEEAEDYSWIFEPVCQLAEDGSDSSEGSDSSGSDSSSSSDDDDDDDSSSTSSSSNSSSSSSSVPTSSNSNTQQSQESLQPMRGLVAGPGYNEFQLQVADPRESTSIFMLQPPAVSLAQSLAPPVATPLLGFSLDAAPIKRRRGRRSNFSAPAVDPALGSSTQKCFQCTHCEASFPNAGDLSKHVRSHITNKPFQCSICQKTFTHIGSLNTHIRIHSGEKPYKCELCPKAFTQSSSLMVHLRSHSVRKPHQCLECDKGFINYSSLLLHQKAHAAPAEAFVCPECEREFKAEALLDEHMRMHTQELVYQCAICREAFRASSQLVQHMKNHMGEKPFTCSLCDRSFTQSGSLNIHMRIHTGEKPFQCKLCDKCFTQASSLSVHMKIHAGEKPFPCPICGKSYSQQAYLNKHIQAHQVAAAAAAGSPGLLVAKQPHETLVCIVCGSLHADATALASHVTSKHAALLDTMKQSAMNTPEGKCSLEEQQAYMQRVQSVLQQMNQQQQQMPLPPQPKLPAMDSTGEEEEEPDEAEEPPDEEEEEEDERGDTPEEETPEEALIGQGYPMLGLQEEQILLDSDMYYDDFADMDVGCQEEVFGDFAVNEEEVYTDALM